jgi:hypothetical protein
MPVVNALGLVRADVGQGALNIGAGEVTFDVIVAIVLAVVLSAI